MVADAVPARPQSAAPTPASATTQLIRIPLTIDYLALSVALRAKLFTANGRMPLWNGSDECQYLYAENPRFARAGDNVQLEADGSLMIGAKVAGVCVSP
ncbi:MAG TPA: hypothetical protein VMT64_11235, partial [Candidatus Binataceae bacterium]|nr:hypothetical protein [Candidatus Binataceae bacterium]